jgi:hypothetical protein
LELLNICPVLQIVDSKRKITNTGKNLLYFQPNQISLSMNSPYH